MIRYPLLSQNCHESQSLIGIVQSRFPYLLLVFWNMPPWILNSARMQPQYSFMALSNSFRHFQTLSNTFKHFQTLSRATCTTDLDQADSCCLPRVQWLLSVEHNTCQRFKHLNVLECKSSCKTCTYNTSWVCVCWLVRRELTHDISWTKLLENTLATKMADSEIDNRLRDRR